MGVHDIIGPVMIGPSSSHTAGAVIMGLKFREMLGKEPKKVLVTLFGSYAKVSDTHGTKLGIMAGLLGFTPDDERIREADKWAEKRGLHVVFEEGGDGVHPNSAMFKSDGLAVLFSSVGGGAVRVEEVNGQRWNEWVRMSTIC